MKKTFFLGCICLWAGALFAGSSQDLDEFDELMGKATVHWRHVKQSCDLETLERAKAIYFKNKAAQYTREGAYKIPLVIHFIWLGPRSFPPESVENVRTWISLNPGWKVKFWTDRDREPPCEGMEKMLVQDFHFDKLGKCYEESQNWGEKSDLLRYEILHQQGGVYVDHDASCLRPFGGMNRGYDFFCCLETPHEPFVGRSVTFGNAVLGFRPGHPAMEKTIQLVADRWEDLGQKFRGNDEYSKIEIVMQRTYIALTLALEDTFNINGNVDIAFPAAYFFAKQGITPLYSKHFFVGAWDTFKERASEIERVSEKHLKKIRNKNRTLTCLLVGLLLFNGSILGFSLFQRRKSQ